MLNALCKLFLNMYFTSQILDHIDISMARDFPLHVPFIDRQGPDKEYYFELTIAIYNIYIQSFKISRFHEDFNYETTENFKKEAIQDLKTYTCPECYIIIT